MPAGNTCPNCGHRFLTLDDEVGDYSCPRCGYFGIVDLRCCDCGHIWTDAIPEDDAICPECGSDDVEAG